MPFSEDSINTKSLIFALSRCWWIFFLAVSSKKNALSIPKVSTSHLSSTEIPFSKSFSDLTSPCHVFDFNTAYSPAFLHAFPIPSLCCPPCVSTSCTKSFLKSASTVWNSLPDVLLAAYQRPIAWSVLVFFSPLWNIELLDNCPVLLFPCSIPFSLELYASLHLLHNITTPAPVWYIVTCMVN